MKKSKEAQAKAKDAEVRHNALVFWAEHEAVVLKYVNTLFDEIARRRAEDPDLQLDDIDPLVKYWNVKLVTSEKEGCSSVVLDTETYVPGFY